MRIYAVGVRPKGFLTKLLWELIHVELILELKDDSKELKGDNGRAVGFEKKNG